MFNKSTKVHIAEQNTAQRYQGNKLLITWSNMDESQNNKLRERSHTVHTVWLHLYKFPIYIKLYYPFINEFLLHYSAALWAMIYKLFCFFCSFENLMDCLDSLLREIYIYAYTELFSFNFLQLPISDIHIRCLHLCQYHMNLTLSIFIF